MVLQFIYCIMIFLRLVDLWGNRSLASKLNLTLLTYSGAPRQVGEN